MPLVITGLDPVICHGKVRRQMAGSSPAMTLQQRPDTA
jgi:hypothetical protein